MGRISARAGIMVAMGALLVSTAFVLDARTRDDQPVGEFFRAPTAHEAHRLSLRERGLRGTRMGRLWIDEAERALFEPLAVSPPYAEVGRFVRSDVDAVGYRVPVKRGQRLEVRVEGDLLESEELFLDLFRRGPDPGSRPARIRSLRGGAGDIELEPREDADYVLRVQPPLFAEGTYRISIRTVPAYAFPVVGKGNQAVWSTFGVERDGGRRKHHGIDIFADRGTPVVAVADARVRKVEETPIGGKVVWLRDRERGFAVYYAHLDSQVVRTGDRVEMGDTLGFVGNTGNARTTPPHLHFGLYRRGPRDPFPYVRVVPTELPEVRADVGLTGSVATAGPSGARLRSGPSDSADALTELDPEAPFRVTAAAGSWYRVRLPDGTEGYLAEELAEDRGLGRTALEPAVRSSGGPASLEEEPDSPSE